MRRKDVRQHVVQARLEIESVNEAVLYWFPAGLAFIGLILHIFPKMTLPM